MRVFVRNIKAYRSSFLKNRDGATAVEFALVGPVIVMLLFGIIQFGIFFDGTHKAQFASEKSARSVRMLDMPDDAEIQRVLENELKKPLAGEFTPNITRVEKNGGTFVQIEVQYDFSLPIPFMDTIAISSKSGTEVLLRAVPDFGINTIES